MSGRRDIPALLALLESRVGMPHAWGRRRNDCMSLVAAAVEAQTGENPLPGRSWSGEHGAVRTLRDLASEATGEPVPLDRCIGTILDAHFERVAPARAMRGDIAGVPPELAGADMRFGIHPMIVEGETLCSPGPRGLLRVPRAAMTTAWSAVDRR